jgi:hypothetical protein
MDMNSKMDGSVPVPPVLNHIWGVQKKGMIDDHKRENREKNKEKKEAETEFVDGRVPDEQEMSVDTDKSADEDRADVESTDDNHSIIKKIDIII